VQKLREVLQVLRSVADVRSAQDVVCDGQVFLRCSVRLPIHDLWSVLS
jgi:hypothetical protein